MTPSRILVLLLPALQAFRMARRGAIAVLFAVMMIPLILATGAAVDFARLEVLRTSLQSVVDGAALAGASALCLSTGSTSAVTVAKDYFTQGVTSLATTATVSSPAVTVPSTIQVTVKATATLQYSFMNLIGSTLSVPVTASAEGPAYQLQVTKSGGFTSTAYDADSIYFYTVTGGTPPSSTASMTLLFTNDSSLDPNWAADNATAKAIRIGANDSVGFALINRTGARTGYGNNGYGAVPGSTHMFYSSLAVPSSIAYASPGTYTTGAVTTTTILLGLTTTSCKKTPITTTVTDYSALIVNGSNIVNCNLHPCTTLSNGVVLENNLLVGNPAACSTPATATKTCLQLEANPLHFAWNDMGGSPDDDNYLDAVYTVQCVPTSTVTTQPNSVILVQ